MTGKPPACLAGDEVHFLIERPGLALCLAPVDAKMSDRPRKTDIEYLVESMNGSNLAKATNVVRIISVGAMIYFYSRASSLYRLVRECLDHVDDTPSFEYCKGYPESIQFHLIGMTISFFVILFVSQRTDSSPTDKALRASESLPGDHGRS